MNNGSIAAGIGAISALSLSLAVSAAERDLTELSLEQLSQIVVTSASKREERLVAVPASLFVITADDIRRSGATTIPEAHQRARPPGPHR